MEETTMSVAFKDATEKLHDRVVALSDEATRRVRENAPRVRKAFDETYDSTVESVRSLAQNRTAQGWLAAGAVALLVGVILSRRHQD